MDAYAINLWQVKDILLHEKKITLATLALSRLRSILKIVLSLCCNLSPYTYENILFRRIDKVLKVIDGAEISTFQAQRFKLIRAFRHMSH